MNAPDALTVINLSAGYRNRRVLRELTLPVIEPGKLTVFAGPNGAGKSTLLRVLAGLLRATGSIRLGEIELLRMSSSERAGHISFMPQTLPQGVSLTVVETVINALRVSPLADLGVRTVALHRRAMTILDRIGIADLALEPLDRLSGGQRQLASLAQAAVRESRVLLLDEPTSNLDLRHTALVMELIRQFASGNHLAVMVLHDLSLAARWADRVIVMNDGTVRASGSPGDAITPRVLAEVYGVAARVERCSMGYLQVVVDRPFPGASGSSMGSLD